MELGLLYYLFSAHNWGLRDLRALWEGKTGWHDLVYAMSSYEANLKAERAAQLRRPVVKVTKQQKRKRRR